MNDWIEECSANKPSEIQQLSDKSLMLRKNIRQVHHDADDGMPSYDEWVCECKEVTVSEYLQSINSAQRLADIEDTIFEMLEG